MKRAPFAGLRAGLTSIMALLASLTLPAVPAFAADATCTADDLAAAVDASGAALRTYNLEAAPKLQARMKTLATKKGWSEEEFADNAIVYLSDQKTARLDEAANALLARIDEAGRLGKGQAPDCSKIEEIKSSGIELLAVMKAKNAYLIAKIDAETQAKPADGGAQATAVAPVAPTPVTPVAPAAPSTAAAPTTPAAPATTGGHTSAQTIAKEPLAPVAPAKPKPPQADASAPWSTSTNPVPQPAPQQDAALLKPSPTVTPGVPRPVEGMTPVAPMPLDGGDGYSIEEIRDATRGFFGTISTSLAAVIEHAFQSSGRPTGYILGHEGGGAFLGGLRYGEGTLYVRAGGLRKIYWHGPSVGFDFGAAGARTMFLVYKMQAPDDLYRTFTGIDGSAFVVGGVGLTLLGGGGMILAPIRSGVGVRMGANVGYVRFTPTETWNPF